MIKGLELVNSLEDLLGKVIVTFEGIAGVVNGFTFDGSALTLVTEKETVRYSKVSSISAIFDSISIEACTIIQSTYFERQDLGLEDLKQVANSLKEHPQHLEIDKLSKKLEKDPEVWRKIPSYSLSLLSSGDSSLDAPFSEYLWLNIPDEVKSKYSSYSQRVSLFGEAYTLLKESGEDVKILENLQGSLPDEIGFLSGDAPLDVLRFLEKAVAKEEEVKVKKGMRDALKESNNF
jgi:hypothetical protein